MTPDRFVVLGGGGEAAAPVTAQPVLTAAARHAARAAARRYKGDTWLVATERRVQSRVSSGVKARGLGTENLQMHTNCIFL